MLVAGAMLRFTPRPKAEVQATVREYLRAKNALQPVHLWNAGRLRQTRQSKGCTLSIRPATARAQCWSWRGLELGMTQIRFHSPDSFAVIEVLEVGAGVRVQTLHGPLEYNVEEIVVAGDVEFQPCLDSADWFFVLVLRGSRVLWMEYHLDGHDALIEAVAARFGESRQALQVVGTASEFPLSCLVPCLDARRASVRFSPHTTEMAARADRQGPR